ncbi:cyclopropane-fatty-acyl-phospholipid synthase family protein [Nocardiopsis sp. CC223A]|uniref:SAM-dependent methyltransferase n=1 Tax=Nocardiopsis sp. CC223A TaxID=3044051 RepID=UPI00278C7995|nr:class I SAM-dependent methyltransferase [Nocardiopsis sp. CC223A]
MEPDTTTSPSGRGFWEQRYRDDDPSGPLPTPNPAFTALIGELSLVPPPAGTPRALELACGRGGDALWLAAAGWHVTAVDIAEHALSALAERARRAGLGDRLAVERHDLARSAPGAGRWDLVYANYFHTLVDLDRDAVLRRAARSVADGGVLTVVDHGSSAPWSWEQRDDHPSAEDLWHSLALGNGWTRLMCEGRPRIARGPDGRTATVLDTVVAARRADGGGRT